MKRIQAGLDHGAPERVRRHPGFFPYTSPFVRAADSAAHSSIEGLNQSMHSDAEQCNAARCSVLEMRTARDRGFGLHPHTLRLGRD